MTVLDKAKQAALYSDEGLADLDPALAREDAGSLLDMVIQVSGCDSDPRALERGAHLFEVMTHVAQRRPSAANAYDPYRDRRDPVARLVTVEPQVDAKGERAGVGSVAGARGRAWREAWTRASLAQRRARFVKTF